MKSVEVIHTDAFKEWFDELDEGEQDEVVIVLKMLELSGVTLGFPASSAIAGSNYALRELRPKRGRSPLRVIYAFDPKRNAVVIIGGDKSNDSKFYKRIIKTAEKIWAEYLNALKAEKESKS